MKQVDFYDVGESNFKYERQIGPVSIPIKHDIWGLYCVVNQ